MASTEKSVMRTEVIFPDDRQQRYLLRKEWWIVTTIDSGWDLM